MIYNKHIICYNLFQILHRNVLMGSLDMTVSMIVTALTTNVTLMVHVLVLNAKTDGPVLTVKDEILL